MISGRDVSLFKWYDGLGFKRQPDTNGGNLYLSKGLANTTQSWERTIHSGSSQTLEGGKERSPYAKESWLRDTVQIKSFWIYK